MKSFRDFVLILEKRGGEPKYSDEYANVNFYNYLVGSADKKAPLGKKVRKAIHDRDYDVLNKLIDQEIEKAKKDKEHPLHFNNASDEGFSGKQKTPGHKNAYYSELERAVPGFFNLVRSKKGRSISAKGWVAKVSGGEHEASKPSWKGNPKGQGRVDYVFSDPQRPKREHRVSGKDYRGSQAGSAQADQAAATLERGVEVAAGKKMKSSLGSPPKKEQGETEQEYKQRLTQRKLEARGKKKETIATGQERTSEIKGMMQSTKGMSPQQQKDVYTGVQRKIGELEREVPGTSRAAGQEMVRGTGQFRRGATAQSVWTTGGQSGSFRDPRQQEVSLRARAGKGGGREMAVTGDIAASDKEKQAQQARQSSFADFQRRISRLPYRQQGMALRNAQARQRLQGQLSQRG